MAKLTAKGRKRMRPSSFALPKKRYPINDKAHARNAQLVDQVHEHAARHPSAHPAYHKHCHLHPDDICPSCAWLRGLIEILDSSSGSATRSASEKARVRAAVYRRYPSIGKRKTKTRSRRR